MNPASPPYGAGVPFVREKKLLETAAIAAAAFFASALTLFSGFGLGTLLMPVMAVFFPLPEAIGLTAAVHLLNNLFKLALLGRYADWRIVVRFGAPAFAAAFVGAWLLGGLAARQPWFVYTVGARIFHIDPVKAVVGIVMLGIVAWEISSFSKKASVSPKFLPLGGIVSGFFGGFSGHQGAFRSAFLLQCGLTKESFLGTGVVLACIIDLARLAVYRENLALRTLGGHWVPLASAVAAAFAGAFLANRAGKKVALDAVRKITALLLAFIAAGLILGLI